jgi:hypothetical protein
LKQKGKSGRAKARAKSERAERELEGNLLPFFYVCVFFLLLEKKMLRESV